jgi:D5 N terminal like
MNWEPSEEEKALYQRAAREYAEKEAARLASEPNPYAKYAELHGNKQDEEYDEDADEEELEPHIPTDNVITLPVISSSTRPLTGKLKNLQELYKKDDKLPNAIICGSCAVYVIQHRGEEIMFTDEGAYQCSDGLWSMSPDRLTSLLNVEIEKAAQSRMLPSNNKLITEASGWIRRQKELNRKYNDIPWDKHGMVPTKSGLVNPRTGECRPMRPEDYCTWRIEAEYDPNAKCPWWLRMLDDVFSDRTPEERAATISLIQELAGVGLIDEKPRELSRALVFQGGSNFGKSGLLEVLGGLFGQDFNSTPISALEGTHGTMPFVKRRPWVLHEAFDQRKWHFSSDVKTIVTGEPVQINIKNGPVISQRVTAPVFWGTNYPPQFKESSKAIANRLVVIECKREFMPDNHVGAAKEAELRLAPATPSRGLLRNRPTAAMIGPWVGGDRGPYAPSVGSARPRSTPGGVAFLKHTD